VDSTINRAHQHGTNLPRERRTATAGAAAAEQVADLLGGSLHVARDGLTGGSVESQGFAVKAQVNPLPLPISLPMGPLSAGARSICWPGSTTSRSTTASALPGGGLSTKIRQLVDGRGRPLVVLIGPGQANDSPMFPVLTSHLRVARCGPGRPRTTPDAVLGDMAYSCGAHRRLLRSRNITAVIPEPSDQVRNRKRRGSRGGRRPAFDAEAHRGRNVVERAFNTVKQWRGLLTR